MADASDTSNIPIDVPHEWQTGAYANFAAVSSQTPHDVTLDFVQLVPGDGPPRGEVVARLKLAPTFLMPLMQVLSNHLSKHEELGGRAEGEEKPEG